MTYPKATNGKCSNCGSADMMLAADYTDYSPCEYQDGSWVKHYMSTEPSAANDAVRFFCEKCSTQHAVPEGLQRQPRKCNSRPVPKVSPTTWPAPMIDHMPPEHSFESDCTFTYEVRPCMSDESGVAECAESEADFWGVYERATEPDEHGAKLATWVADFARKEDATVFRDVMEETNK